MAFNSIGFVIFFVLFFISYWMIFKNHLRAQNILILIASYIFYAWADWRFLFYLIGISGLNFFLGIYIEKKPSPKNKRWLLYIGLIQGIGGLVFFKYFNFFIGSFNSAFHSLKMNWNLPTLQILLPLGISFFTFRTLSYLLDIDKQKIKPTKDWVIFFNYVAFFPTILSGPIDKARTFIPQLEKKRVFNYSEATDGLRQILWGLFKKVVIADNCATFTNNIFGHYDNLPGATLLVGIIIFTFQLYADFSGYSDMAIGISRLIGFNVTKNFDFPLFSQNIAEFWRKWHISLTSWLTEYLFTPLSIAFRDYNKAGLIFAILINFIIIGLWHGANWTFVLFGFIHGCLFIPLILSGKMNKRQKITKKSFLPSFKEFLRIAGTFMVVTFTLVFFRSASVKDAFDFMYLVFTGIIHHPGTIFLNTFWSPILLILVFIGILMTIEWIGRDQNYAIENIGFRWPRFARWSFYYCIIITIFLFAGNQQQFIYFQF